MIAGGERRTGRESRISLTESFTSGEVISLVLGQILAVNCETEQTIALGFEQVKTKQNHIGASDGMHPKAVGGLGYTHENLPIL
jgi:hypothetical protein